MSRDPKQTQTKPFVAVENSREPDQIKVMRQIAAAAHCPFCPDHLSKYHTQPILHETDNWLVTTNQWPYKHTQFHFLLILKTHATSLVELEQKVGAAKAAQAGAELFSLVAKLERQYSLPGGGFAMRFGDPDYSAGSVTHLHVQLVTPNIDAPEYQPIRIKIGKDTPFTE